MLENIVIKFQLLRKPKFEDSKATIVIIKLIFIYNLIESRQHNQFHSPYFRGELIPGSTWKFACDRCLVVTYHLTSNLTRKSRNWRKENDWLKLKLCRDQCLITSCHFLLEIQFSKLAGQKASRKQNRLVSRCHVSCINY